jgi:hypothetical protein
LIADQEKSMLGALRKCTRILETWKSLQNAPEINESAKYVANITARLKKSLLSRINITFTCDQRPVLTSQVTYSISIGAQSRLSEERAAKILKTTGKQKVRERFW